jgi:hypothetical protein
LSTTRITEARDAPAQMQHVTLVAAEGAGSVAMEANDAANAT